MNTKQLRQKILDMAIKGKLVPRGFDADVENVEYNSLLDVGNLIGELFARCFSGEKVC